VGEEGRGSRRGGRKERMLSEERGENGAASRAGGFMGSRRTGCGGVFSPLEGEEGGARVKGRSRGGRRKGGGDGK